MTVSTSPFRSGRTVRTWPCPSRRARVCIDPADAPADRAARLRTTDDQGGVGQRRGDEEAAHRDSEEREAADRDRGAADERADEVPELRRDGADGADLAAELACDAEPVDGARHGSRRDEGAARREQDERDRDRGRDRSRSARPRPPRRGCRRASSAARAPMQTVPARRFPRRYATATAASATPGRGRRHAVLLGQQRAAEHERPGPGRVRELLAERPASAVRAAEEASERRLRPGDRRRRAAARGRRARRAAPPAAGARGRRAASEPRRRGR